MGLFILLTHNVGVFLCILSSNGRIVGGHERVKQPNKPAEPRPVHEAPPRTLPDNGETRFKKT